MIKIYFEKYIKAARAPGKNICEKWGQATFVPEHIVDEHQGLCSEHGVKREEKQDEEKWRKQRNIG